MGDSLMFYQVRYLLCPFPSYPTGSSYGDRECMAERPRPSDHIESRIIVTVESVMDGISQVIESEAFLIIEEITRGLG